MYENSMFFFPLNNNKSGRFGPVLAPLPVPKATYGIWITNDSKAGPIAMLVG